jgi:hypothetical protein
MPTDQILLQIWMHRFMMMAKVTNQDKASNIQKLKNIKKEKRDKMELILRKLINMTKDLRILKKNLKIMMMIK